MTCVSCALWKFGDFYE